jgi:hypothetical protein
MPRPHEDLERHAPTDHRPGGPPIEFAPGAWCAIDVAHVRADRVGAGIAAYETLIEKARTSSAKARAAVVLRSVNNRRVIALIVIAGHDAFRHLKSAWDDHHLTAERHAVAESSSLALYKVAARGGSMAFDPASTDAYAFEHVAREPERVRPLISVVAAAPGFRGVLILGSDDAAASAVAYQFEHAAQFDAFRESSAAQQLLGPVGASGETITGVHPVKTLG